MAGIDAFSPAKAFTLALLLAGVNPKNLLLSAGAGAALAQLGPTTTDAVVSWIVYVVLGSITIAGPSSTTWSAATRRPRRGRGADRRPAGCGVTGHRSRFAA